MCSVSTAEGVLLCLHTQQWEAEALEALEALELVEEPSSFSLSSFWGFFCSP